VLTLCDIDLSKGEEAETEVFPGTKLRIVHSMDMGGLFMNSSWSISRRLRFRRSYRAHEVMTEFVELDFPLLFITAGPTR
jgi:hypothetical protein